MQAYFRYRLQREGWCCIFGFCKYQLILFVFIPTFFLHLTPHRMNNVIVFSLPKLALYFKSIYINWFKKKKTSKYIEFSEKSGIQLTHENAGVRVENPPCSWKSAFYFIEGPLVSILPHPRIQPTLSPVVL